VLCGIARADLGFCIHEVIMVKGILHYFLAGAVVAVVAAAAPACSSKDTAATSGGCADFSAVTNTVSFKKDVIPLMQRACNFDACHASTSTQPQEGLELGSNMMDGAMTDMAIAAVHGNLIGKTAKRSTLKLVEPGSPDKSWLVAKVRYANFADCPAVSGTCTPKGCGAQMPQNQPLPDADINIFVAWVKGGAKND
jgi:hypothetical protein